MPCSEVTLPSYPSHAIVAFVPPIPHSPDADGSESSISTSSWGGAGWCDRTSSCAVGYVSPCIFLSCHSSSNPRSFAKKVGNCDGVTYAVDSPRWQACVALAADHLVAVVLGGKGLERWLNDATTETEDQVESRLLLDVVVGKGATILELLSGEDQALLVRGNALLVLDLGLDVVCPAVSLCFPQLPLIRLLSASSRCAAMHCGHVALCQRACVPMVSDDSTSRVIVLPVTAT
jgi:hypothetical protein